jgi:hypothetical protein
MAYLPYNIIIRHVNLDADDFLLRGRSGAVGAWTLCWGVPPMLKVCSVCT